MSNSQAIEAIYLLRRGEHLDVMNYIKNFNSRGGFMYNDDAEYAVVSQKTEDLLDSNGMHSGGSWGCMLRTIQAVLNRETTVEQLIEEDRISDERYLEWKREQAQQAQAQAQEKAQVEQAQVVEQE
jgi:hypothetical protein